MMADQDPITDQDNITSTTCITCGRKNVSNWDGRDHCITCTRDLALMAEQDDELKQVIFWSQDRANKEAAINQLIESRETYDTKVANNCRLIANNDIPGTWLDPVTGKKLYNEAAVDKRVAEAKASSKWHETVMEELDYKIKEFTNIIEADRPKDMAQYYIDDAKRRTRQFEKWLAALNQRKESER